MIIIKTIIINMIIINMIIINMIIPLIPRFPFFCLIRNSCSNKNM